MTNGYIYTSSSVNIMILVLDITCTDISPKILKIITFENLRSLCPYTSKKKFSK